MSRRGRLRLLMALSAALVLGVTLWPVEATGAEVGRLCVLCGSRGFAEALLNVALFVPFGVGVAGLAGPGAAVASALLLSGSVEGLQLLRPDRYATLGDLVFNTAGGALGAVLPRAVRAAPTFLARPGLRGRWALRAASFGLVLGPALLIPPATPATRWFGQWTPELGHFERYEGTVLAARVGPAELRAGPLDDPGPVRSALRGGGTLDIRFVAGPATAGLAPLVAIHDAERRPILVVGVEGESLVYLRHARGAAFGLEGAGVGWRGVLADRRGDTVRLRIARRRAGVGLSVDGGPERVAGPGAHDGWRVVFDPGPTALPSSLAALLGGVWIGACSAPAGAVARGRGRALLWGLALGSTALGLSWALPGLAPHAATLPAAVLGAVAADAGARWWAGGARSPGAP